MAASVQPPSRLGSPRGLVRVVSPTRAVRKVPVSLAVLLAVSLLSPALAGERGETDQDPHRMSPRSHAGSFGKAVAGAGDLDQDGFDEILVGAPSMFWVGRAYCYRGTPIGPSTSPFWRAGPRDLRLNDYGESVRSAGDVNGDGFDDIVVGAPTFTFPYIGGVMVFFGSPGGLPLYPSWVALSPFPVDYFGAAVDGAGDVNGDGYSDLIVGARESNNRRGMAYLYLGGPGGLASSAAWLVQGRAQYERLGAAVAGVGDVNQDGYDDVVVGATGASNYHGEAYLYLGRPSGLSSNPAWTGTGEGYPDVFGSAVGSAGDINADGYADVVVGAWAHDSDRGKAYVYLGWDGGLGPTASWTATGEFYGDVFGNAVATAGDVNDDGFDDVLIGAPGWPWSYSGGRAYLYLGSTAGLSTAPSWIASPYDASARFGEAVASAGDVNADGYDDIIVGAYGVGRVDLYLGGRTGPSTSPSWSIPSHD